MVAYAWTDSCAAVRVLRCAVQAPYKGVFQKIGEMFQTS